MFVKGSNCCSHISVLRFDMHVCFVAVIVCNDRLLRFCVRVLLQIGLRPQWGYMQLDLNVVRAVFKIEDLKFETCV